MARWKLTEPHYLNVPSSRWEFNTTDRNTGKPTRKQFPVPMHLDPRLEDDWNVRVNGMDGEIHVCHAGKDTLTSYWQNVPAIEFVGDPTPGMVPLDVEAKEISGKFNWIPTQGIDEDSQRRSFYMQLADTLVNKLTDMKADVALAQPQTQGVEKILEAMSVMMAQNQQLMTMMAHKMNGEPFTVPAPAVPVEDELERQARELGEAKHPEFDDSLDAAEPTAEEIAAATAAARAKEAASQERAKAHVMQRKV